MTTFETAKYMRTSRQTLAKWRCAKVGPAYYRVGGRIRYHKEDINDFVAGGRVDDTAA
jgi:excisionase family DNA binding protein